jgi:ATP-dependent helicase/nuclease subunit A
MIEPIDARERQASITDFGRNIVLTAPAGSGKTTVLVGRIVHWLLGPGWERHHGDPGRLEVSFVALTFTRAAAAEMAARVVEDLQQLAAGPPTGLLAQSVKLLAAFGEPSEIGRRARALCSQPLNLEITTLHSFCIRLIEPFSESLSIPPDAQFSEPSPGLERAMRRVIVQLLGEQDEPLPNGVSYASVVSLLEALISEASLPDSELGELSERFDLEFINGLEGAIEHGFDTVEAVVSDEERNFFAGSGKSTGEALSQFAYAWREGRPIDWRVLSESTKKLANQRAKRFAKLSPEEARTVLALHAAVFQLRSGDPKPWLGFVERLPSLIAEARRRCRSAGLLRFDDAVRLALDSIRRNPGFVPHLHERLDLVLVDEAQDTDPSQCALIEALCRDAAGRLRPGMLFVVGDRAQSIYGFRDADVDAFDRMVERLVEEGGSTLTLQANFRSDDRLIEGTNRVFDGVATSPLVAARKDRGPGRVSARAATAERIATARQQAYRYIASEVRQRLDAGDYRPSQIACLHHGRKAARALAVALRDEGVPAQLEGASRLLDMQPARDLLCLSADLLGVASEAMVFGWLRSPLSGLSEAQAIDWIAQIRRRSEDLEIVHPLPLEPIEQARRILRTKGLEAAFGSLRDAGRVPGSLSDDERMIDSLELLVDVVVERANDPATELAAWFEDALSGAIDLAPAPSTQNAVRLMTIHGAKGLQFPWTILDMIHHPRTHPLEGFVRRREAGELRYTFKPAGSAVLGDIGSAAAALKQRELEEFDRKLYVAFTRGEHETTVLHWAGGKNAALNKRLRLFHQICPPLEIDADTRPEGVRQARPLRRPSALPPQPPSPGRLRMSPSDLMSGHATKSSPSLAAPSMLSHNAATLRGTLVHHVLEACCFDRALRPQVAPLLAAAYQREAGNVSEALLQEAVIAAGEQLDRFVDGAICNALASAEILARELPFSAPAEWLSGYSDQPERAVMATGIIDLIYRLDGELVVADWKTNRAPDPGAMVLQYGDQMRTYQRVVRGLFPNESVRALLILVDSDQAIETPPASSD